MVSDGVPAFATFYRPAEVAKLLRCSQWWIKEQARNRRIPYAWIGGSYLFSAEHVAEIVRRFEVRPVELAAVPAVAIDEPRPRRAPVVQEAEAPVLLRARSPRRARNAAASSRQAA